MKVILFVISALISISISADEITLKPNEAVVIVTLKGKYVRSAVFKKFDSPEKFIVNKQYKNKLKVIKVIPGDYYLQNIESLFSNVMTPNYDQPNDRSSSLKIEEGSVTYLGDWHFKRSGGKENRLNLDLKYSPITLNKYLDRFPELEAFPLRLSVIDGKSRVFSWK